MAAVKSKNTTPEITVRRLVHGLGFRYGLHDSKLPGKPDLVFASRRKVIFVHGCFWHRHNCRRGRSFPKVREEFWKAKFDSNTKRDRRNVRELRKAHWGVLVIWSCETHSAKRDRLVNRISKFLGPRTNSGKGIGMPKERMKAIDVFSGVGGLGLGAARAGLEVAVALENDPHALASHKRNFRSTIHVSDDVTAITGDKLLEAANSKPGEPLALIGGPPCQGFSTIGLRCNDDPRNQLFVKFFELVREIQPVFFLAENVPGIMSSGNSEIRDIALALVKDDYELLQPITVIANEFGVPTIRKRVLFIGYKNTHFSGMTEDIFRVGRKRVLVKEALNGLPKHIRSSWQSEEQGWRQVNYPDSQARFWKSVRSRIPNGLGDPVAIKLLAERSLVSGFLGTRHSETVKNRYSKLKPGEMDKISKASRLKWDGYCPTLRAGTGSDHGSYQAVRPIHPSANRVITPREAARLQGFPDWFQFSATKWHSFRQIGNSVSPIVAEAVIRKILNRRNM